MSYSFITFQSVGNSSLHIPTDRSDIDERLQYYTFDSCDNRIAINRLINIYNGREYVGIPYRRVPLANETVVCAVDNLLGYFKGLIVNILYRADCLLEHFLIFMSKICKVGPTAHQTVAYSRLNREREYILINGITQIERAVFNELNLRLPRFQKLENVTVNLCTTATIWQFRHFFAN